MLLFYAFYNFIINENYKNSTCHFAILAPIRINNWTSSFYLYTYAQFAQKIITDTQRIHFGQKKYISWRGMQNGGKEKRKATWN